MYSIIVAAPRLARKAGGGYKMLDILLNFIFSVFAGIVANVICVIIGRKHAGNNKD